MKQPQKNSAAVALGRLGGQVKGKCKARDPEKMRQAGIKGARKRWGLPPVSDPT